MVGRLVQLRREAEGLTQTELASRTGLRQTYISQVERGEISLPRDHNLDALGKVLGLSRADFYRAAGMFEENDAAETPAYTPNIERFRNLAARPRIVAQLRQFEVIDDSLFEAAEIMLEQLLKQAKRSQDD